MQIAEEKRKNKIKNVGSANKRRAGLFTAIGEGSAATKASAVFMGSGQIARGQIIKGIFYLAAETAFVLFMIFFGGKYVAKLFSGNLGTRVSGEIWNEETQVFEKVAGDNSFLILLYGVVSLVVCILFVLLWAANVKGSYENDLRLRRGEKILTFKEDVNELVNKKFYIPLLLPPFIGLLAFTVLPLIFMILIAFTNYDYNHMPPGRLFGWVGLQGFKTLLAFGGGGEFPKAFAQVLLWTFVWAFFATFTNFFLGMFLAMLINKKGILGKAIFRAAFVTAIAVPQFVTLLLMQKILDRNGILNVIFGSNVMWLTDTRFHALIPKLSVILVNIWIGVPYTLLMCSGLLMNVSESSLEAARMDGANPVQIFFKITLPYILQMTTPYLITQFVGNINNFNVIWLLTNGGPLDSVRFGSTKAQATDLLVTWLYRLTTDANPQYNVASVIGIVIFVVCAAISLITFNKSGATKNEEAYQ